ncbi:Glucose N-acetyltransferase 1 [Fusarium oxysporum f. sp. cubense]|uniref:Glucose N-acetyltransferase 1 n=1 Tax=Fusarium oxysporum f. sp. cubense TaxID=61366 RepID=A0A559KMP2_FUSOC|nr:Glucose N-acetyltransferase 1 [Fusarium oxysporum f. sp. cubense]
MQLNLPPRLLRIIIGCIITSVILVVSIALLIPSRHSDPANPPSSNSESKTWFPLLQQKPSWTTEQLEPKFAYAQYATNLDYLCNAIINFSLLRMYGASHDLVLIFPKDWSEGTSEQAKAIDNIRSKHPDIYLRPMDVISTSKGDATWRDSLTKFQSFSLTEWTRILAFDSDSLVLNTMDYYFLSPMAPLAVPRAYWLNEKDTDVAKQVLGSHVMLLEPSKARYNKIIKEALQSGEFDMEVINHMFRDSAMILPHRRLALLTGEFRAKNHSQYLAPDEDEEWNAMAEVSRASLVHFSDWPLPKPWKHRTAKQWNDALPDCPKNEPSRDDRPKCADRVMWTGFYEDYDRLKDQECGILYEHENH